MIIDPCIYIIQAYAGHGKDYTKDIIESIIERETKKIHFAKTAKDIISSSLKNKFIKNLKTDEEKLDKLNDLKDNFLEIKVLGDKNAREMLQLILGEVIRFVNPEIHALFALKEVEKELLKEKPRTMICTDNRYKNEQEILYPINLINTNEERIDYVRWRIDHHKTKHEDIKILEIFEELTNDSILDKEDADMINKIKMKFINKVEELNNTKAPKNDFRAFINDIDFDSIDELSIEEGLSRGIINVFRPLIPEINDINKNDINENNLNDFIKSYNKIDDDALKNIIFYYEKSNIAFNLENVKKYGFLRADPNHSSECDLNGRKPEKLLNIPFWEKGNIKDKLNEIYKENKKKNIINYYNNIKPI